VVRTLKVNRMSLMQYLFSSTAVWSGSACLYNSVLSPCLSVYIKQNFPR